MIALLACTVPVDVEGDCGFVEVSEVRAGKPAESTGFTRKEDYVELHNFGPEPVQLWGYSLSNVPDFENAPWIDQDCSIPGGGHQVVLAALYEDGDPHTCGEPDDALSLRFDMNNDGDALYVWTPEGTMCEAERVDIPDQHEDFVWQRDPDAPERWCHGTASPGTDNGPCDCAVYDAC